MTAVAVSDAAIEIPLSLDEGGRLASAGQGAATARRVARRTVARSGGDGGSHERRSAARRRSMDAGAVTTARTVMRPAHPVQRVTFTWKVRRKRMTRSTRKSGA